ncbi:hypothetical protein C7Y70_19945 [Pseudoalteromonas sp. KS88]|uniref:DUF4019 domain-containing protein n=1 Tax=Pseudoalteromonas sp. KS88 TaxID=2109918 RepID=UPI00108186E9|nr:DUF4019 domain-containing protein [Pseudoalteromonas sp. KS88]TGE76110.1 hypothetical protein C7Y70_19945 [Pseudoalteromonas sp. KS88]
MKKQCVLLVFMVFATFNLQANEEQTAATQWLALVDSGDYSLSWQHSDAFFKENVSQDLWVSKLGEVRNPLGDVKSRQQLNRKTFDSLPQLPKGEYVLLQFNTDFTNRSESTETVTLKKSDQKWLVIGYFIQ